MPALDWAGSACLLYSDGGISTAVGVIDNGVEGLVNPLPEDHGRSRPANKKEQKSEKNMSPSPVMD